MRIYFQQILIIELLHTFDKRYKIHKMFGKIFLVIKKEFSINLVFVK